MTPPTMDALPVSRQKGEINQALLPVVNVQLLNVLLSEAHCACFVIKQMLENLVSRTFAPPRQYVRHASDCKP